MNWLSIRCLPVLILFCLCVTHAGAAVRIAEFCPDPYLHDDADEYIVLSGTGALDGITVSDGRGGFRFPAGAKIDGSTTVARSGKAFEQSHGRPPDFEWLDTSPDIPDVISGDTLRMANTRGALMLYENGNLVQKVSWPGDVKPREGQVHFLENGRWDPRPLMIGQSRFPPAVFRNVSVTAFVSPDCSDGLFAYVVNNATKEILLNVYEFSSPAMGEALMAAHNRGADVQVLVEGGPVGGILPEEKDALWQMNRSGIPVSAMVSSKDVHAPYRYDHAKYAVIDRRAVLLTSENFKFSGFAETGTTGNRGWGVYLEDPALAGYFSTVFLTDMKSPSVVPYSGAAGNPESPSTVKYAAEFAPRRFDNATVIPVLAPDTSGQIADLIKSAEVSIEIEEAYITNETPLTLNPYLSAAINASRRGVRVRVLLDSYWYNVDGRNDNDEMVALINRIGAAEHIPLEARCADLDTNRIEKIHNKGVIVDGRNVLVSSINWNSNSPSFNREAGVIIDHPAVAQYFLGVFEDDWNPSVKSPGIKTDHLKIAAAVLVIAVLLMIWYRRHRV
ncbi:MAG: phospholipase D-like domain-containing protein [Methanoregula sp.]|jgi:phosphatidylserine/phosphatidylglycerophosphate/cardiolipin synthase-like enzyme|uniref:phospholipase D-like domain-containing protein n=1 Tax=Methanoregula sp. TaxID=2052170 RepID=UPI003D118062